MPAVISLVPEERFKKTGVALPPGWDFVFLRPGSGEDIISACRDADFLLMLSGIAPVKITARVIENIPMIKMIQMDGAGCDTVDLEAAARQNIPVANSAGQNAGPVAELTIGFLVALQRRLLQSDQEIKAGNYSAVRGRIISQGLAEIFGSRIGLVGLGAIGRRVAGAAKLFGAQVSYYDLFRSPQSVEDELGVSYRPLDELLAGSDVISVHVPLTEQTREMIGRREFGLMAPGAIFINTARGEVVDQNALAEALEGGRVAGAAVDTLSPEPPPPGHPLLSLSPPARERLIISPHIGGVTTGAIRRMLVSALENMARVAAGGDPEFVVNGVKKSRQ